MIRPNLKAFCGRNSPPPEDRFHLFYVAELDSGCWRWIGAPVAEGYGTFRADGKQWRAHRYSWVLHYGEIPDGTHVLHKCDNPPCVNPDHLFLGTDADNAADKVSKSRQNRGLTHGMSRLSEVHVKEIRADDRQQKDIANDYGITQGTVSKIKLRKTWRHI